MLNEEDVLGNGFLDPDASRYLLSSTTSSSINRSLSMPLQLGNPWNTDSQFEPVVSDLGQHSTTAAVDDDILGAGVTAASVLGKSNTHTSHPSIHHWAWQTHPLLVHTYSGYRPSRNIQPCLSTSSSHRRTGDPGFIGKSNCFGWITTKDRTRGNQPPVYNVIQLLYCWSSKIIDHEYGGSSGSNVRHSQWI